MSDAITEARAAQGGLTFDWGRGAGGRPVWLVFFVLVSVIGHAACFYLFQVVYPPQKRELLRPVEVTVLDPSDPLTSDVLRRIDDRVVAFDARGSLGALGVPADLNEVNFHPFFENYEPALRDLPPAESETPTLFAAGRLYLPPPTGAVSPEVPEKASPVPEMKPVIKLRWGARVRKVVRPFVWKPDPPVARPQDSEVAVFYIGVDRTGRIVHSLPEQSAGTEMDGALHRALRGTRFAPADGEGIDWGWAEIRW